MIEIDSTKIIIASKELGRIADAMNHPQTGMSSGEIALIAAGIGASAALFSQLLVFILNRYKEKANLKQELIAEERRISFLLSEYYKHFVSTIINKNYWYRISVIQTLEDNKKASYERHIIGSDKNLDAMEKIRITTSEYFKVVTHFKNINGKNKLIDDELQKIKELSVRNASLFEECKTYDELMVAQEKEKDELNTIFANYSVSFDKINKQMEKK